MKIFRYLIIFLVLTTKMFAEPTVIILNGPSAAGKSSLQRAIQKSFPEPYLKVGIDTLFDELLPDVAVMGVEPQGFDQTLLRSVEFTEDAEGNPMIPLTCPLGRRVVAGMHGALAAYAKAGNSLVVDYIAYEPDWIGELAKFLQDYRVVFVGVKLPLEVLETREKGRGTSPIGHARSHYDTVHTFIPQGSEERTEIPYDLEVDTSANTPEECAQIILEFLESNPEFKALEVINAASIEHATHT